MLDILDLKDYEQKFADSLIAHIAYVKEAGRELRVPPRQLEIHDNSKWSFDEFFPYAKHFHGEGDPVGFSGAWLHHIHHNPHHWQHWIFPNSYSSKNSGVENGVLPMPENFALEMIADWQGAGKAYTDSWDMSEWLIDNVPRIKLHSKTAIYVTGVLIDQGYESIMASHNFSKG